MGKIVNEVAEAGGLDAIPLRRLRNAIGYKRLDTWVVVRLRGEMRNHNLDCFPRTLSYRTIPGKPNLPSYSQDDAVLVCKRDTKMGRLVSAVIDAAERPSKENLELLRLVVKQAAELP